MSNKITEFSVPEEENDGMLPEYDFSAGVRGKYHRAFRRGYKVIIHKQDGTMEERDFTLPEGAVMLDPDLRDYFPDSDTVNRTLRGLLELVPSRPSTK